MTHVRLERQIAGVSRLSPRALYWRPRLTTCGRRNQEPPNKLWEILKEMGIPDHLTCLLRNLYAGQEVTELDMEQQIGSKQEKEYVKTVYCLPAYLTYMRSTSCEMPGWMKHKLESRLLGEISITSDMQMTPPLMAEKEEELKSLLVKVKEESEKVGFKAQHSEN